MKRRLKLFLSLSILVASLVTYWKFRKGIVLSKDCSSLHHKVHFDGPYLFEKDSQSYSAFYIKGNDFDGISVDSCVWEIGSDTILSYLDPTNNRLDSFILSSEFNQAPTYYKTQDSIFVISDIESNYFAFSDMLKSAKIIDDQNNWIFGKGHLVLCGDFMDKGFYTTQVLWLIYKLENQALKNGGRVHFIIGNHDLLNLQGFNGYTNDKYHYVAAILKKPLSDFYNKRSFLGKWLRTKNSIEKINDFLFVHGGLHPHILSLNLSLHDINESIRQYGYNSLYTYHPKQSKKEIALKHYYYAPQWYRGLVQQEVSRESLDSILDAFSAKRIIVGHTIVPEIKWFYEGKVIAVDVVHPNRECSYFSTNRSKGLMVIGDLFMEIDLVGGRRFI